MLRSRDALFTLAGNQRPSRSSAVWLGGSTALLLSHGATTAGNTALSRSRDASRRRGGSVRCTGHTPVADDRVELLGERSQTSSVLDLARRPRLVGEVRGHALGHHDLGLRGEGNALEAEGERVCSKHYYKGDERVGCGTTGDRKTNYHIAWPGCVSYRADGLVKQERPDNDVTYRLAKSKIPHFWPHAQR